MKKYRIIVRFRKPLISRSQLLYHYQKNPTEPETGLYQKHESQTTILTGIHPQVNTPATKNKKIHKTYYKACILGDDSCSLYHLLVERRITWTRESQYFHCFTLCCYGLSTPYNT